MKRQHKNDRPVSGDMTAARPVSELSDAELLAQLLAGPAAQTRSQAILREFGGLGGLARQTTQDLARFPGLGAVSSRRVPVALELARRCAREALEVTDVLSSPQAVRDFLHYHLGFRDREVFSCLYHGTYNKKDWKESQKVRSEVCCFNEIVFYLTGY